MRRFRLQKHFLSLHRFRLREQCRSLLTAPWFIAVMAVIGGLIVVYLILVVFYKRKQRLLRRVRKFRDL